MNNIVYGKHLVLELLKSSNRIEEIFLNKKNNIINNLVNKKNIKITYKDKHFFNKLGDQSQNMAARVKPFAYYSLKDLKHKIKNDNNQILILDQIQSPFNFGSLIRTAKACGFKAIIIAKDNQVLVTSAVEKIAVGYSNKIPIVLVTNINEAIKKLKEWDFWIYGTSNAFSKTQDFSKTNFDGNVALVLGSESKGIRPLVLKSCDFVLKISIIDDVESLNVSVAGGILMHKIFALKNKQ